MGLGERLGRWTPGGAGSLAHLGSVEALPQSLALASLLWLFLSYALF